jgi:hypothetical protein
VFIAVPGRHDEIPAVGGSVRCHNDLDFTGSSSLTGTLSLPCYVRLRYCASPAGDAALPRDAARLPRVAVMQEPAAFTISGLTRESEVRKPREDEITAAVITGITNATAESLSRLASSRPATPTGSATR